MGKWDATLHSLIRSGDFLRVSGGWLFFMLISATDAINDAYVALFSAMALFQAGVYAVTWVATENEHPSAVLSILVGLCTSILVGVGSGLAVTTLATNSDTLAWTFSAIFTGAPSIILGSLLKKPHEDYLFYRVQALMELVLAGFLGLQTTATLVDTGANIESVQDFCVAARYIGTALATTSICTLTSETYQVPTKQARRIFVSINRWISIVQSLLLSYIFLASTGMSTLETGILQPLLAINLALMQF